MDLKGIGLIIICCLTLGQCTTKKSPDSDTINTKLTDIKPTEQENYEAFISRFNTDTVFQKSRVKYDLSKYFDKYYDLSLSSIDTSEFKITTRMSDNVAVRITNLKDSTYWVQYIFKKENGIWYLTEYGDTYGN